MNYKFTYVVIILITAFMLGGCYKEQHFDMPGPYGEKEIIPDTLPFPFDSTRQAGMWLVKNGIPDYTKTIFKGYTDFKPQFGDTSIWFRENDNFTSYQCWNYFALSDADHFGRDKNSYMYTNFFTKPFVKYFPGSKWYFYAKMSLPYIAGTAPYFWFGGKTGINKRHTAGIDGGGGFDGNPIFFMQVDGTLINSADWPIITEVMTPDEPFEVELICVDYFVYFKVNGRVIWYYNLPEDVHSLPIMYNPWRNAVSMYDVYMEGDIEEVIDFVCHETEGNYATIQAPALTRADNGDILLFGEGRVTNYEHTPNAGYAAMRSNATDIVMKRSTDDGATWNELKAVQGERNSVNIRPMAITDTEGRNYLLYTVDNSGHLDGTTFDIYQRISNNNGNNWNAPEKITSPLQGEYTQATISGHGLQLRHGAQAGRLAVLTTCVKTGVNTLAVLYSDDRGANWQAGATVNATDVTDGSIIELSDGRLMVIMSHNGTTTKCKVAYSSDGGQTWGNVVYGTLNTGTRGYRYAGATLVKEDGTILHFTPNDQVSNLEANAADATTLENAMIGNPAYGKGLGVTTSVDNGQSWDNYENLFTKVTYDTYYILCKKMDAIILNDGRTMCITESGVKCPKEGLVKFYK